MRPEPEQILHLLGVEYLERSNRLAFCCPIHADRDPSAGFYLDTKKAHCFVCSYTLDTVSFYARCKGIRLEQAIRELEKTFGDIEYELPKHDPARLIQERYKAERALRTRKDLPLKGHASLGEQLDRILLAYERDQLEERRLDTTLGIWYNRVGTDEVVSVNAKESRTPEAGPDGGIEEGPRDLLGDGSEDDGHDLA